MKRCTLCKPQQIHRTIRVYANMAVNCTERSLTDAGVKHLFVHIYITLHNYIKRDVPLAHLLKGRRHFSQSIMVSITVSNLTSLVFVQPAVNVDSSYYCDVVISESGFTTRHSEVVW